MGLFWDLMQQSQISEQKSKANSLETRVTNLERELHATRRLLHHLVKVLEENFGKDFDGDGRIA
ncbi:MAG: hypothetical protein H8E44_42755 [Planctomycetes bacterium]|nr:hypothetical protein [Planctomycetota bacterium]